MVKHARKALTYAASSVCPQNMARTTLKCNITAPYLMHFMTVVQVSYRFFFKNCEMTAFLINYIVSISQVIEQINV